MVKLSKGKCGRKRSYSTREDAIVAASTKMRCNLAEVDWCSFRAYLCPVCGMYHLTKDREEVR